MSWRTIEYTDFTALQQNLGEGYYFSIYPEAGHDDGDVKDIFLHSQLGVASAVYEVANRVVNMCRCFWVLKPEGYKPATIRLERSKTLAEDDWTAMVRCGNGYYAVIYMAADDHDTPWREAKGEWIFLHKDFGIAATLYTALQEVVAKSRELWVEEKV